MIPHHFFYLMVVLGLLWIFCMRHVTWETWQDIRYSSAEITGSYPTV
jgi:hypothetical protein